MNLPKLNKETHVYTLDDGSIIPSVTQVIEPLTDFSMIPSYVLERKSMLGNFVHIATEMIDHDMLDENSVDDKLQPYLNAYMKFRSEHDITIIESEQIVYHHRYSYAGTLDRIFILNDKISLIDIKTTSCLSVAAGVQTSAYAEAYKEMRGLEIESRYALQLKSNGTYVIEEYKSQNDLITFRSLLHLHHWSMLTCKKPFTLRSQKRS